MPPIAGRRSNSPLAYRLGAGERRTAIVGVKISITGARSAVFSPNLIKDLCLTTRAVRASLWAERVQTSASILAARMKSFSDSPPMECVQSVKSTRR
jgi:hypothetical protein